MTPGYENRFTTYPPLLLSPHLLTFDTLLIWYVQLFDKYHAASPCSRAFKTCLIEMVAVAIHQTAVYLYKLDLDLGGHRDLVRWVAPTNDTVFYQFYPDGKLPSLFMHNQYRNLDQYPNGAADMVAYWAEAQIFGGVVLFDRRKSRDFEPYEDVRQLSFPFYLSFLSLN